MSSLPTINSLTWSDIDYRPAVGPDGDKVVFERTPLGGGHTLLYLITNFEDPNAKPFLSGSVPTSQTRPDWCWKEDNDKIAFNGGTNDPSLLVYWVYAKEAKNPTVLNGTEGMAYPTWSQGGKSLVSENGSGIENNPSPCNTWFAPSAGGGITIKAPNIDGNDTMGVSLFGGMPTVGHKDLPQIAFAGQPIISGWGPPAPSPLGPPPPEPAPAVYNENYNYIFINYYDKEKKAYTSSLMESAAPLKYYDAKYQGRAPAWSPDGKTIAFESNRSGNGYAIYLYDLAARTVTQVTDPPFQAQHAKFFPDGKKLILCALNQPFNPTIRGIAWVDISALLGA